MYKITIVAAIGQYNPFRQSANVCQGSPPRQPAKPICRSRFEQPRYHMENLDTSLLTFGLECPDVWNTSGLPFFVYGDS